MKKITLINTDGSEETVEAKDNFAFKSCRITAIGYVIALDDGKEMFVHPAQYKKIIVEETKEVKKCQKQK